MELTYTNRDGESITLKQSRPYFLTKVDGTGNIRQTVNTFKAPDQDGAFYISSTLDMRNITIEGTVVADTPDEAFKRRQRFLQIFSPKLLGTLQYRDRQISCVVEEAGFSVSNRQRIPNFFVSLLCPSPFFETLNELREELASWIPLFEFELEIPMSGMEFGMRQPSQIITVENIGDVSCGCEIVFRALGTVSNPELLNIDTGEYIRLLTTMSAGDELRVYTHFAGKRVIQINGSACTNAFSLLDTNSVFFQLAAGLNTLRYDASVNMELLEVSIYFVRSFWGCKDGTVYLQFKPGSCGHCGILVCYAVDEALSQGGSFELKAIATLRDTELLKEGNIIWKNDDEEVGIIEHLELSQTEHEIITASGRFATSFLSRRIVWQTEKLSGDISTCVEQLLNNNLINPSDVARKIANISFSAPNFNVPISTQVSYRNLMDAVTELCVASDVGIKTVFTPTTGVFTIHGCIWERNHKLYFLRNMKTLQNRFIQ